MGHGCDLANDSGPAVIVGNAYDVVFAEIGAGLNLDQLQRQLAGILQPVLGADRDVDGLVLAHEHALLAALHDRRAVHYDPVLGAMIVLLQAELAARLDGDALDLEAVAGIDRAVVPPGAMAGDVLLRFGPVLALQLGHHARYLAGRLGVGDQHRIVGGDDHDVVESDRRHQPAFAADIGVADAVGEHVAVQEVAVVVQRADVAQRGPGTDIAPRHVDRHDRRARRVLHDGVVDREVGRLAERLAGETEESEIFLAVAHRALAGAQHRRVDARQLAEIGTGAQQENSAVPEEGAAVDEALCRGAVGLLDEAIDAEHTVRAFDHVAALDVAVAAIGAARLDAKGDQAAVL